MPTALKQVVLYVEPKVYDKLQRDAQQSEYRPSLSAVGRRILMQHYFPKSKH